jgi:hypothetical protein
MILKTSSQENKNKQQKADNSKRKKNDITKICAWCDK